MNRQLHPTTSSPGLDRRELVFFFFSPSQITTHEDSSHQAKYEGKTKLKRIPIAMLRVVSARLYHHRLERLRKKMNTNIALEYTSISTRSRKSNGVGGVECCGSRSGKYHLVEENKESPTAIILETTQTAVRKGGRKRMPHSNRKELQRSLRLPQTTRTALERICIGGFTTNRPGPTSIQAHKLYKAVNLTLL
uniref:Uncharacterized protein n=1 Tax=Oryza barthii TaxID=65489 RepID=A0A0D3EL69_9ORYZ